MGGKGFTLIAILRLSSDFSETLFLGLLPVSYYVAFTPDRTAQDWKSFTCWPTSVFLLIHVMFTYMWVPIFWPETHVWEKLSASKHNITFPCVNSWSKNKRLCLSLCICGRKIIASNKSLCQYIAHEFVLSIHLRFYFLKCVFWILCAFNFI